MKEVTPEQKVTYAIRNQLLVDSLREGIRERGLKPPPRVASNRPLRRALTRLTQAKARGGEQSGY